MENKYLEKIAASFEENKYDIRLPEHDGKLVLNLEEFKDLGQKAVDKTKFRPGATALSALGGGALGTVLGSLAGRPGAILGGVYGSLIGASKPYLEDVKRNRLEEATKVYENLK